MYVTGLPKTFLRLALITMYKTFVRPHLDYGNMIYDEAYNEAFHQKLETIQYNACLALLEAIIKRKTLPCIRVGIPQTPTLVQETLLILLDF